MQSDFLNIKRSTWNIPALTVQGGCDTIKARNTYGGKIMGPYYYEVIKIDGDYATLKRTDIETDDTMLIAMALLPFGTDTGSRLKWENLEYSII